jgi:hypothetical protein
METMEPKEKLKGLLRSVIALQDAMRESVSSAAGEFANLGKYTSFKIFMRKYNLLAKEAAPSLHNISALDEFKIDLVKDSGSLPWPVQKERFDHVSINVAILRSLLESAIGFAEDETQNLKDFIQANLRKAIFTLPEKETEIQNGIESLLIGRRMVKGIDYDRETGRVKTSGKESIPDFIFPKLKLCLEVKLSKSRDNFRTIVDEINADVRCYGTVYERQLYVVYDLASIRDEAEFKKDIASAVGVSVVIVKH